MKITRILRLLVLCSVSASLFLQALMAQTSDLDAAVAKVKAAEQALKDAQETYRKALLDQASALRKAADELEKRANAAAPVIAPSVTPAPTPAPAPAPAPTPAPAAAVSVPLPSPALAAPTPAVAPERPTTPETLASMTEKAGEWEARTIFGFHQAGASSAPSTRNYFFDFFVMRGLSNHAKVYNSRFNLWGNIRIGSAPQQIDASLGQFVSTFAEKSAALPVNQLAQSGEFLTGLGMKLKKFNQGDRIRMIEAVAFWGANGSFSEPTSSARIFKVPGTSSLQRAAFLERFKNFPPNGEYVGLVPPDRERFYRQYGGGMRLSTFETRMPYAPPGSYMFTLGQDQMITEGGYRGAVAKIDVFYPLPIGKDDGRFKFLFLFGTVNMRISKPQNSTPLALEPAADTIKIYAPTVGVISAPSARDTYRIGAGVDFVNLFNSWRNSLGKKAVAATPPQATAPVTAPVKDTAPVKPSSN